MTVEIADAKNVLYFILVFHSLVSTNYTQISVKRMRSYIFLNASLERKREINTSILISYRRAEFLFERFPALYSNSFSLLRKIRRVSPIKREVQVMQIEGLR